MDKTGLQNDELYALVEKAYDALHHLNVELHYRNVGHGCGKAPNGQVCRIRSAR